MDFFWKLFIRLLGCRATEHWEGPCLGGINQWQKQRLRKTADLFLFGFLFSSVGAGFFAGLFVL